MSKDMYYCNFKKQADEMKIMRMQFAAEMVLQEPKSSLSSITDYWVLFNLLEFFSSLLAVFARIRKIEEKTETVQADQCGKYLFDLSNSESWSFYILY